MKPIKLKLIAKGVCVEKICKTQRDILIFERDMPAKFGLLYSGKTYAIGYYYEF